MKQRRLGRFEVSDVFLREAIDGGDGANLFVGAVPLDVMRDFCAGKTTYICWHPDFEICPEGQKIPQYVAIFRDGESKPTWKKLWG